MRRKKKIKIYFFTGKRGGFSHFIPILREFDKSKNIEYQIIAADMHLSDYFGKTINEIKRYSERIISLNKIHYEDTISNRLLVISKTIESLSRIFRKKKPDYLFLLGDRAEVLGAAIACMHHNIPIIHLYGGDITQGGTDEPTRHAITKIANIHLTSNLKSFKNIKNLGEETWRIKNVGLLSLDLFRENFFKKKSYLEKKFSINLEKPLILLIQHPVTWQIDETKKQIKETLAAIAKLKVQTIAIYPCSDPGFSAIINSYKRFTKHKFFKLYKNIEINEFYSLLKYSSLLIGNSSCGITECGYLKKYVLNIGIRQEGRVSEKNVIHTLHKKNLIIKNVKKILQKPSIKKRSFLYGNGRSAKNIKNFILKNLNKKELIKKKFIIK